MAYIHITIHLKNGKKLSGIRAIAEPLNLADVRKHAWQLSAESLGRGQIDNVTVAELPADHPHVVAYILRKQTKPIPQSDGRHPYLKDKGLRPRH